MGPEGIILVNPPITTFQQSLTHSEMVGFEHFRYHRRYQSHNHQHCNYDIVKRQIKAPT